MGTVQDEFDEDNPETTRNDPSLPSQRKGLRCGARIQRYSSFTPRFGTVAQAGTPAPQRKDYSTAKNAKGDEIHEIETSPRPFGEGAGQRRSRRPEIIKILGRRGGITL